MNTQQELTALKEESYSKIVTFEKYLEVSKMPMGHRVTRKHYNDYSMEDFFAIGNPQHNIKDATWWIEYKNKEIKNQEDYIEFLGHWLIHMLEEDEDSYLQNNGKLFESYEYENNKTESKRLVKNAKAKISRLRNNIKDKTYLLKSMQAIQPIFDAAVEAKL